MKLHFGLAGRAAAPMGVLSAPNPLAERKLRKALDKTSPLGAISALCHWDSVLRKWDSDTRVASLLLRDWTRILPNTIIKQRCSIPPPAVPCRARMPSTAESCPVSGTGRSSFWPQNRADPPSSASQEMCGGGMDDGVVVLTAVERHRYLADTAAWIFPLSLEGLSLSLAQSFWKCFLAADKALNTSKA